MKEFGISFLKLSEVQQCAQFIAQRFVKQQIFKAFQINAENLASLIKRIASYGIKRALAFKVIHLETMKVAAYFLLTDLYDDKEIYDQRHYDKNTNQYLNIFHLLYRDFQSKYKRYNNIVPGVWVRASQICINQQFKKKNLGFNIFKFMIVYLMSRDYTHAVAQTVADTLLGYIPRFAQNLEYSPLMNEIQLSQLQIEGKKLAPNSKGVLALNYYNLKLFSQEWIQPFAKF